MRKPEAAKELVAELSGCFVIVADVTDDEVQIAIAEALSEIGRLDVLVNNAGLPGQTTEIERVTTAEVDVLLQTHCLGALRCSKAVIPFMGNGRRQIVNVTSRFGSITRWASGAFARRSISYSYRIAKASQNMLTVCLAKELSEGGFIVCGVHPGRIRTLSGANDANTEPVDAAKRLACLTSTRNSL